MLNNLILKTIRTKSNTAQVLRNNIILKIILPKPNPAKFYGCNENS